MRRLAQNQPVSSTGQRNMQVREIDEFPRTHVASKVCVRELIIHRKRIPESTKNLRLFADWAANPGSVTRAGTNQNQPTRGQCPPADKASDTARPPFGSAHEIPAQSISTVHPNQAWHKNHAAQGFAPSSPRQTDPGRERRSPMAPQRS
jgi:hypothetical protein